MENFQRLSLWVIMSNRIFTILFLFFSQSAISQKLIVEAVYYDNNDVPYKIERKYSDNNLTTYVTHFNQGSVSVKRQTSIIGETTIIKETYYHVFSEKTKLEKFQDCKSWNVSSNTNRDTVLIKGYIMDSTQDTMILVGDTMLIGESAKNNREFFDRIKTARIPLLLNNEMNVNTDSLILIESVLTYLINGVPTKVEVFDSKNKKYCTSTGSFSKNSLIWKRTFNDNVNKPYQIDIISWNKDTTEIVWNSNRIDDIKWNTIKKFYIKGTQLNISYSDTLKKEIEYIDSKSIFRNILIGDFVYSDILYYMELRYFEREKIVSITKNGQTSKNNYTFDLQGRIVEKLAFENEELQNRVTYKYLN